MRLKPKSTVHNPRALLYKRFTDVEESFRTEIVYKTINDKLWLFSTETEGFKEYNGSYKTAITVSTGQSSTDIIRYKNKAFTYRKKTGEQAYFWETITDFDVNGSSHIEATIEMRCWALSTPDNSFAGEYSVGAALIQNPFPQEITITPKDAMRKVRVYLYNEQGYRAEYKISGESYYDDMEEDIPVTLSLDTVQYRDTYLQQKNTVKIDSTAIADESAVLQAVVNIPVASLETLQTTFNNIGRYQTNKYYLAGSFDYMIRGSIGSSDTQPIKGNIMHLRSFEIKYFDDNIHIDHDDLVVIDGRLYGVEELAYDIKRSPKPYTVYFATLNNIK